MTEKEMLALCIEAGIESQKRFLDLMPPRKKAWKFVKAAILYAVEHDLPVQFWRIHVYHLLKREWLQELQDELSEEDYGRVHRGLIEEVRLPLTEC